LNVELVNFLDLSFLSSCMLGEKNCYILLFGMFGYLMNISVGGHSFLLKFNIRFYFIKFVFLHDIRGEKNINVNWTRWITNWRILKNKSILHPSIHPSIHGAMMGAAYIWPKNTYVCQHPPFFSSKKLKILHAGQEDGMDGKFICGW